MPYATIALLVAIVMTARFVVVTSASQRAKAVVLALCLGSIAIGVLLPQWALAGLLLQAALVIGLVVHAKLD